MKRTPLPEPLRIGGRAWTLSATTLGDGEGLAGNCSQRDRTISVANDQDPQDVVDTVLHEACHALLYAQGREYGGKVEETYVRALATGLTTAFVENPHLLDWIKKVLHP